MHRDSPQLSAMKAEMIKALAHPLRLSITEFLSGGERCVCDIAGRVGAGRSNVSRHLALMVRAGVLSNRKEGLMVLYRLRCPCVMRFLQCVDGMLRERIGSAEALLRKRRPRPVRRRGRGRMM